MIQLGCGITGLVCAEHLEKNSRVDEIVLADSRIEAARSMVSRVRSEKMSALRADGTDSDELRKLMKGCDLIISSLPWELNRKVLDLAISTGTDYVDFCLTVDSEEDLKAVISRCQKAGIIALTATGEDPGISDVFAVHGASKLDKVEEAHVRDGDSGVAEGFDFFSLWSPIDLLEETTVPAAVFRNGKMTFDPPLDKREMYEFPPPVGPLPVYYTNHEETYLMPRFIKGLRNADFQIAIDDNFASVSRMLRKLGLHSLKPIDVKGVKVRPLDVVVSLMPRPVDLIGKVKGHAIIVVDVVGEKDGVKKCQDVDHDVSRKGLRAVQEQCNWLSRWLGWRCCCGDVDRG